MFGSKILTGMMNTKNTKFQVRRFDDIIVDNLTIGHLKHHKKIVSQLEKGQECGISFEGKEELTFKMGDIIECYTLVDAGEAKFKHPPGVQRTF